MNNDNFGVPKVDNTPMGIVEMEGNFFRGIVNTTSPRPMWVRIVAILLCIFAFLIPGIFFLLFSYFWFSEISKDNNFIGFILFIIFGVFLSGVGIVGIKANIFRKK